MGAEHHAVSIGHTRDDLREEVADLIGCRVANGIRQIDRRGSDDDDRLDDPAEKIDVGASRIFGGELHVVRIGSRQLDAVDRRLEALLARHVQLVLEMKIGGREEGVNPAARGARNRVAGAFDVGSSTARQTGDDRAAHFGRDPAHRLRIIVRRNRKTRLYDVDTERVELPRHLDLLVDPQREPRRLLAVTQRRVKDRQPVNRHRSSLPLYLCFGWNDSQDYNHYNMIT